jgi:hypothetical protein
VEESFRGPLQQFLHNLGGPMSFRFVLQPFVASLLAIRAGIRDARQGKPLYFWTVFADPVNRKPRIREGWKDISRVFFIAVAMDWAHQLIVTRSLEPGHALIVAAVLALFPYLVVRGLMNWVVRLILGRAVARDGVPAARPRRPAA